MSKSNITGKAIDSTLLNLALYGELDPDYPRMSEADRKAADELWNSVKSTAPIKGSVVIASTAGAGSKYFNELWKNASESK